MIWSNFGKIMLTKKMYPTAPPLHTFEKSLPFSLHLGFFLNLLSKLKYTAFFLDKQKNYTPTIYPLFNVVLFTYNSLRFLTVLLLITTYIEASIAYIHVSMWRKKSIKLQKYTTIAKNQNKKPVSFILPGKI